MLSRQAKSASQNYPEHAEIKLVNIKTIILNSDSSVGVVTRLQVINQGIWVIPGCSTSFSSSPGIQNDSGASTTPYSIGTGGFCFWGKRNMRIMFMVPCIIIYSMK